MKTTKHKRAARRGAIHFNPARAVRLFNNGKGKSIADIAVAMGYPRGHGQNRTRAALMKAGVYKVAPAGKVLAMPKAKLALRVPTGTDMAAAEVYAVAQSRYGKLANRARPEFVKKLTGMLVAGMGATGPQKIAPVALPEGVQPLRHAA